MLEIVGGVIALCIGWLIYRNTHIGCGMVLEWKPDGTVFVVSRLLKSPAGHAGVRIGDKIRSYNGHPMHFHTKDDFKAKMREILSRRIGETVECVLESRDTPERTVTMKTERIWGGIPVYEPMRLPEPTDEDRWRYQVGMGYCTRTGQWVPSVRLSEEALDRILRK